MQTMIDTGNRNLNELIEDLDAIGYLSPNDIAYIKRSNGEWQPAVVIETSVGEDAERRIKFLLDNKGRTKTISAPMWTHLIRLNSPIERRIKTTKHSGKDIFSSIRAVAPEKLTYNEHETYQVSTSRAGFDPFSSTRAVAPKSAQSSSSKDQYKSSSSWDGIDPLTCSMKAVAPKQTYRSTSLDKLNILDSNEAGETYASTSLDGLKIFDSNKAVPPAPKSTSIRMQARRHSRTRNSINSGAEDNCQYSAKEIYMPTSFGGLDLFSSIKAVAPATAPSSHKQQSFKSSASWHGNDPLTCSMKVMAPGGAKSTSDEDTVSWCELFHDTIVAEDKDDAGVTDTTSWYEDTSVTVPDKPREQRSNLESDAASETDTQSGFGMYHDFLQDLMGIQEEYNPINCRRSSWISMFEEELNEATKSKDEKKVKSKSKQRRRASNASQASNASSQDRAFLSALAMIDNKMKKSRSAGDLLA